MSLRLITVQHENTHTHTHTHTHTNTHTHNCDKHVYIYEHTGNDIVNEQETHDFVLEPIKLRDAVIVP